MTHHLEFLAETFEAFLFPQSTRQQWLSMINSNISVPGNVDRPNLIDFAAKQGNIDALTWLFEQGAKGTEEAVNNAAYFNHISTLNLLFQNGYKASNRAVEFAAYKGNNLILELLFEHDQIVTPLAQTWAKHNNHSSTLTLLVKRKREQIIKQDKLREKHFRKQHYHRNKISN